MTCANAPTPEAIAAGVAATGLPPERVSLAFSEVKGLDPWDLPRRLFVSHGRVTRDEVSGEYATEVEQDPCGCCGSITIFLVGPAGSYAIGGTTRVQD